jgi:hypothetical protein
LLLLFSPSPRFHYYQLATMAAAIALRKMYIRLGFTKEMAVYIMDTQGINNLDVLENLYDEGVQRLCQALKKPGGMIANPDAGAPGAPANILNPGFDVLAEAEENLKLAVYYGRFVHLYRDLKLAEEDDKDMAVNVKRAKCENDEIQGEELEAEGPHERFDHERYPNELRFDFFYLGLTKYLWDDIPNQEGKKPRNPRWDYSLGDRYDRMPWMHEAETKYHTDYENWQRRQLALLRLMDEHGLKEWKEEYKNHGDERACEFLASKYATYPNLQDHVKAQKDRLKDRAETFNVSQVSTIAVNDKTEHGRRPFGIIASSKVAGGIKKRKGKGPFTSDKWVQKRGGPGNNPGGDGGITDRYYTPKDYACLTLGQRTRLREMRKRHNWCDADSELTETVQIVEKNDNHDNTNEGNNGTIFQVVSLHQDHGNGSVLLVRTINRHHNDGDDNDGTDRETVTSRKQDDGHCSPGGGNRHGGDHSDSGGDEPITGSNRNNTALQKKKRK